MTVDLNLLKALIWIKVDQTEKTSIHLISNSNRYRECFNIFLIYFDF